MKRIILIASVVVAVLLAADVAWNGWAIVGRLDYTVRQGFWILLVVGLPTMLGLFIDVRRWKSLNRNREADELRRESFGDFASDNVFSMFTGWLMLAGVVVALIWGAAAQSYIVKSAYLHGITTTSEQSVGFHDRAPWVLADSYASRDQGDDVGDRGRVKHVPTGDGESSRYTTLITGRDALGNVGYKAVREYDLPKTGPIVSSRVTSSCEFPESMTKRWDAPWPNRSLNRDIAFKNPLLHFTESDRYGFCRDGKPVVVQPLWRFDGWLVVTKVPAGIAEYTDEGLRIKSVGEALDTEVPGPIFPQSLAETYREALPAMGSWGDWVSQRGGYDLSDKDADDTNAGNTSEIGLVAVGGEHTYVTPLTPRGSSQNLTALLLVNARDGSTTIDTSPNLPATSSIEDTIRSESVAGDPNWATRWSSGMTVYEMVPGENGYWVASIGLGQIVNYRADIAPDGTVTVTNTEGSAREAVVDGGKPLSDMSEAELLDLMEQVVEELQSRG